MLLDEYMPAYDFGETYAIEVRAAPADAYRAVREVTPGEIALLRTLFRIRSAPAHRLLGSRIPFGSPEPLIGQALRSGFVLLAEDPGRELALGPSGSSGGSGQGYRAPSRTRTRSSPSTARTGRRPSSGSAWPHSPAAGRW
jgi:hypothetical protein